MSRIGIIGLGLVASGKRAIVSFSPYENLYSRAELLGTNPIIGGDFSDTYDTLNHMAKIVLETLNDTRKVAPTLIGKNLEETLRNNWNHVYKHFQYSKDATGIEQLRRPARAWTDRKSGIDCDCMSIVLSSLMHWQKINHTFRKAQYNNENGWQHVYVVVPKKVNIDLFDKYNNVPRDMYYVLDCVVDKFNYEVPFLQKFDKLMKIQYLNGLDQATLNGGVTSNFMASYNPVTAAELLGGFGCEFDGLHGFGESLTPQEVQSLFLRGLKQHLVNTRSIIAINPALTKGIYEPALFMQRLDALISSFDKGTLGRTLRELAELEQREGLGQLEANIFQRIASGVKTVAQKVKATAKGAVSKLADTAKKVGKFIVRYNPLTVAVRSGLLLAMKLNLFRMAEKLGYGYWTETQASQAGLDLNEWRKNKAALGKARNLHQKIGGKLDKFDNAVKKGWEHGVKKHNLPKLSPSGTVVTPVVAVVAKPAAPALKPAPTPVAKVSPVRPVVPVVAKAAAPALKPAPTPVAKVSPVRPVVPVVAKAAAPALKPAPTPVAKVSPVRPVVPVVAKAAAPALKPTPVAKVSPVKKGLGEVVNMISGSLPLLQMINEQLSPLHFNTVLRKGEVSELEEFLQAVRTNRAGIATKLSLAYKPVDVANTYNKTEYSKLLSIAQQVEKLVQQKGGTNEQLRDAVNAGKQVALSKDGLGGAVIAAISAAIPVLTTIATSLKNINFLTMFRGKANSPHPKDDEIKNSKVTAEIDEDTFDEGDPSATVSPEFIPETEKKSSAGTLVKNLVSNLVTPALVKNVLPSQAKDVVAQLTPGQAADLVNKIQSSPEAAALKDTPLFQEVAIIKTATEMNEDQAEKAISKLTTEQVKTLAKKIKSSPQVKKLKETPLAKEIEKVINEPIQEAEVIETKLLPKEEKKDNTVMYVAIGTGVALALATAGYFMLRKPAVRKLGELDPAPGPQPTPEPPVKQPEPVLSGVKKVSKKLSQRTRKVMAITI